MNKAVLQSLFNQEKCWLHLKLSHHYDFKPPGILHKENTLCKSLIPPARVRDLLLEALTPDARWHLAAEAAAESGNPFQHMWLEQGLIHPQE